MQNQNPKHSAPKQHSKLRRGIVWTIVALVAVIGIGGAYAVYQTKANIDQPTLPLTVPIVQVSILSLSAFY